MRRATTPTVTIGIDRDLTGCWYRVILAQRDGVKLVKDETQCVLSEDGKTISVTLSQEETLGFSTAYDLQVQVRFGNGSDAAASDIAVIRVREILDEEVIT